MKFIHRQAPARAALLVATTLLIACAGNPTATEPETSTGGTKKVSKKSTASPKPGASAPTGASGGAGASPTAQPTASTGTDANGGTGSPSPSASPSSSLSPSPSPSASASASTSPSPSPSATASSGGSGGGSNGSPSPTSNPTAAPTTPGQSATPAPGAVTAGTFAGEGTGGFDDGAAATATFFAPRGLAVHASTGDVYVADTNNHAIRKIAGGQVTTVIGTGSAGTSADARTLNGPRGIAVASDGTLYIADTANNCIRKLGAGEAAKDLVARQLEVLVEGLNGPTGLALTADQTALWIVDAGNHCIRRVTLATGEMEVVAGNPGEAGSGTGSGVVARFNTPRGCAAVGNDTLYVVDSVNAKLRKIVVDGNAVTVSNVGETLLDLVTPSDVFAAGATPEGSGGSLLVADTGQRSIQRLADGQVENLIPPGEAGFAEGAAGTAQFRSFGDVVVHPSGAILVADPTDHRIRALTSP